MNNELIQKYLKGEATKAEKADMLNWIEADVKNRKEFLRYRKLYDTAIWIDNDSTQCNKDTSHQTRWFTMRFVRDFMKVAAVVAIAVVSTLYVQQIIQKPSEVLSQVVEVPQGQYVNLTLSDGTKVTLNANSKLVFPAVFDGHTRIVELDGEGYFEVTHNAHKPFYVRTHRCDVKVLGTKFNVLAFRNSSIFETSLVEGSVEVTSTKLNKKQLLRANEKVVIKNDNFVLSTMQNTNELLWKDGILVFDNRPLSEIFDKLNSYFGTHIVVGNKTLLDRTCTAKFRQKDGLEHILRVLKESYGFELKHNYHTNEIEID